jgi:hypothetical protein
LENQESRFKSQDLTEFLEPRYKSQESGESLNLNLHNAGSSAREPAETKNQKRAKSKDSRARTKKARI